MNVLLSLDLSTTCTGWAKFCLDTFALLSFGIIVPDFKNPKKLLAYPQLQVLKLKRLAEQVIELIDTSVKKIVIEEINRGKNRLGQKVLDGFHFVLLSLMEPWTLPLVNFRDSDGLTGWRSAQGLRLQLSALDKASNKERKKFNKKLGRGQKKLSVVTQKTLACRFVNRHYDLALDCDVEETDGDKADAIGLGHFYIHKVLK